MIRSSMSRSLGRVAARRYARSLASGKPWQIPTRLWELIPAHLRSWLDYRVIQAVDEQCRAELTAGHPLSGHMRNRLTPYSLPAASIMMLWGLLHRVKPRKILEAGSGISTVVFAAYARATASRSEAVPLVVSLEHDCRWADATREMLSNDGLSPYARVINAPIGTLDLFGHSLLGYSVPPRDLADIVGDAGFDFLLIDGPPAHAIGRLGSLLVVMDCLLPGATVILDDALRDHERECWHRWSNLTNGALSKDADMVLVPHGMLISQWRGVARSEY
jgi:predicted O-methyltransferase YrrM